MSFCDSCSNCVCVGGGATLGPILKNLHREPRGGGVQTPPRDHVISC